MDTAFNNYNNQVPNPPPANPAQTIVAPPKPPSKGINKGLIITGVFLILVLGGLVLGFDKARSFLSKAAGGGGCELQNLKEVNLTPTSVEVVFQTTNACQTSVNYGISQDGMLLEVPEAMASLNHRIRLSPLLPSTTYYYQLKIEGEKVDPVKSFLTLAVQTPTQTPVQPTLRPTTAPVGGGGYTFEDFQPFFGTSNPTFDIDKNGIVNSRDWLLYQKTKSQ